MPLTEQRRGDHGGQKKSVFLFEHFLEKSPEKSLFHNDIDNVSGNTDEKEQKAGLSADGTVHRVRTYILLIDQRSTGC